MKLKMMSANNLSAAYLLGAGRHAIGLVQNNDLVRVRRQRNFLLCKHFDAIADDIDAAVVAGVQLENALLVCGAEQLVREAENAAGEEGSTKNMEKSVHN